ncbi:squalene cyclase [Artemisia annua]|uniref:Terpene cyclase/mutase family member n=1 Tax=Artemisia annua TaxID=35608 RepID=A0A2U1Q2Z4_ARTAN|nr:squalene cyclase [Artemisia annua]
MKKSQVQEEKDDDEVVVKASLKKALRFYSTLQGEDGSWPADYGGPLFLLPGLVIGLHVMGAKDAVLSVEHQREIRRYLYNHQEDLYYPHPMIQDIIWGGLHKFAEPILMRWPFSKLRKKALDTVMEHIHYEDENTRYICIGPVNKGYNGSQLWDAVFAVQAISATKLVKEYGHMLEKAHNFIKNSQIRENSSGHIKFWYRHITCGGWPFSTPDNGWPVSDCTAEALKTVLMLSQMPCDIVGPAIAPERLYDAVHLLLTLQNENGGFSSYEPMRSYPWLEVINPAETFGDIIVDYQYVECTSAVVQGLTSFMKLYPSHKREEIQACVDKAITFIENMQLPDGVYEWMGNNPLPPEMWLLPYFVPLHPGRMWCHTRMVYLPMSYLYGKRFVGPMSFTVLSLRRELYGSTLYHQVNWDLARNQCAKEDLYYPHPMIQDIIWGGLHKFAEPILMRWPFSKLRKKALDTVMEHIHYEDENTRYICIGPVNKGYNGSQLWDAVFAAQAISATNLVKEYGHMLQKAHNFIKNSQIRENSSGHIKFWYRHITRGGWPFSTPDNGWPVSDCTAEALKTVLMLSQMPCDIVGPAIAPERLYDAVHLLLTLQNENGGFSSYEPMRSYPWLEVINPAETFGDIIVDYQYVECTSAVVQGLTSFMKLYPSHKREEIQACVDKAMTFIENMQLPDGSWYGSWAICYTYGTWFGIKGLVAAGKTYETSDSIRKACAFLLSKQLYSGGWGESYTSCMEKTYTNIARNKSHITNTSWALLALIEAEQAKIDRMPLDRAAKVLIDHQMENGDFPQQEIIGVFNKNYKGEEKVNETKGDLARTSSVDKGKEKVTQDETDGDQARTSTVDSDYDDYLSLGEEELIEFRNSVPNLNEPNDEKQYAY